MDQHPSMPLSSRRLLLGLAAALAAPRVAFAQAGPSQVVERFHAALIELMRNARQLGVRGRFDRLRPEMDAAFDLAAMTRIAVGPPWSRMTPEQQQALVQAFSEWSIATYANRFNGYSGESFTTSGETVLQNGDGMVRTSLNRANDAPVQLNYLMRNTANGGWRIVDVYLTGTISELASRRSEFATILQQGGADRLASELRRQTAELLRG
ncbi:phospholipid transport system substrate-binding protein [Roseomonas rosea]|uniref:Phospholipid transport system substrate-binding protein n=1 Tax=Muricoccus roseus TaxID=198092 RepID=A0A1M6MP60_9PROT|nr:ABC transporter substrate-binding protein [Roseomonas rosea]SHJ85232.1 phospholipid transport system substrate-binding protein [Roseomonas rosea]